MVDRATPLTKITFERITSEEVALYCQVPPPGENINILSSLSKWMVQRLRTNRF